MKTKQFLNQLGYMVTKINPTCYRIRGEGDELDYRGEGRYIDFWPVHKTCKAWNAYGKPTPYTDLVETVRATLKPWPTRSEEEGQVYRLWRDAAVALMKSFPQSHLAVKKTLR